MIVSFLETYLWLCHISTQEVILLRRKQVRVKRNVGVKIVRSRTHKKGNKRAYSWVRDSQVDQVRGRPRLWEKEASVGLAVGSQFHKTQPSLRNVQGITVLSYIVASNAAT